MLENTGQRRQIKNTDNKLNNTTQKNRHKKTEKQNYPGFV